MRPVSSKFGSIAGTPLSHAYPQSYGNISQGELNKPTSFRTFFSRPDIQKNSFLKSRLLQTAQAQGAVLSGSDILANAVLLSPNLVVLTAHSSTQTPVIQFPGLRPIKGSLVLDGKAWFNMDFMLVRIPSVGLQAAPWSVSTPDGYGLQFTFNTEGKLIINPFNTESSSHATRSQSGGVSEAGYSGGARFSMTSGAAHSILEGNGEGLTFNAILIAIKSLAQHQTEGDRSLYQELTRYCLDPQFLELSATPIPIQMGMVDEESKGIGKKELKNKGIFTDHFVDKHTAKDLPEATANACRYGKTVTVMKVTPTYLSELEQSITAKVKNLTPTTLWHFVNGVKKESRNKVNVAYDKHGKLNHVFF